MLGDPNIAFRACQSLAQDRLAAYVHTFYVYQDQRRMPRVGVLPLQFWQAVQLALTKMYNLESLLIWDPALVNTWILDPAHIKFQLREAKFRLLWDPCVVSFLETQTRLRTLQTIDGLEDETRVAPQPNSLQTLQSFDGPLLIAAELLSSPLKYLQVTVDHEAALKLLSFISSLISCSTSLRALNFFDIPEDMASEVLGLISTACPNLHYVGLIPLPWNNRHKIHQSVMRLQYLSIIEFDVAHWTPPPNSGFQRAVACEVRMYCPTIQTIVFWIGLNRFIWMLDGDEWHHQHDSGYYPAASLWRTFLPVE